MSFTLDLSQTDTTSDDRQSPRISFSLNLSQMDGISPEKRKREDAADVSYDTDFEFCVISSNNNNDDGRWNTSTGETLLPVADELFVDGKILPLIHGPLEGKPVTIAHHLSLEISRCRSPVRSISSPPSKIASNCWGNVACKSLYHKPPNKWRDIIFKLSTKENARAQNSEVDNRDGSGDNVKQQTSPTKSLCPFSRSCSTDLEMKGRCLFCSLPCSRIQSTAEHKYKAATSKHRETDVPVLVQDSKPLEARRISNKVQPDPRCLGELKPRFQLEDGKEETKVKRTADRVKLDSPGIPTSRMRGSKSCQRTTGRVGGNGRFMARNLERCSSNAAKAATLDSPLSKRMAKGSLLPKANNSMGVEGMKVSPVVNVSVCIGYGGGGWIGGGGLFGFFSKREKKQQSAYHLHRSHATVANRKKGT